MEYLKIENFKFNYIIKRNINKLYNSKCKLKMIFNNGLLY